MFRMLQRVLIVVCVLALAFSSVACNRTSKESTIKIGALWPLTGSQAAVGQEAKRGLEMAVKQINDSGGLLGKKVELVLEDDKSDPGAGVTAINKLLTVDKIKFFVGGYSSTVMSAVLERIKAANANVIAVVNGTTSSQVEQSLGKEKWLFKLYPYDYHYQSSNISFLKTVDPRPSKVAIVYEDALFGTTQGKFAKEFLQEAGFNVVAFEPFKSGTPDLSPLLTRIKNTGADMLFWIGYFGDCILLVKQSKEIDFNPKLFVGSTVWVGMPEFVNGLGKSAEYVIGIDLWTPDVQYPASSAYPSAFPSTKDWVKSYTDLYKQEPNHWSLVNYIAVEAIAQSIKKAKTTEFNAVESALRSLKANTPMGELSFRPSKFGGTQGFTDMVVFQWQDGKRVLVYPPSVATGKLKYPTPAWNKR